MASCTSATLCRAALKCLETLLWLLLLCLDVLLHLVYLPMSLIAGCRHRRQLRSVDDNERKRVVVVGSGFGGLEALRHLSQDVRVQVVLISQRDHFEYTPGILRLFCEPTLFSSMACRIPEGCHELILGSVTRVHPDSVSVALPDRNIQEISFDYLLLSMGGDYRQPITAASTDTTMEARAETWKREAERLENVQSVLVLGGGAVGTELAAEIIDYFPSKEVTIITGAASLVPAFPPRTVAKCQAWLQNRGARLVLGERIVAADDKTCATTSGREFKADMVYNCLGSRPQVHSIASGNLASVLGPKQELKVTTSMQVEGHEHIFAVGDMMTFPMPELKQAFYAQLHGKVAAQNILRLVRGNKELLQYPEAIVGASRAPLCAVLSLGRCSGSLVFNEVVINGFIAALVKWMIEWTKVQEMRRRPVGLFFWKFADSMAFLFSRCCCRPPS